MLCMVDVDLRQAEPFKTPFEAGNPMGRDHGFRLVQSHRI